AAGGSPAGRPTAGSAAGSAARRPTARRPTAGTATLHRGGDHEDHLPFWEILDPIFPIPLDRRHPDHLARLHLAEGHGTERDGLVLVEDPAVQDVSGLAVLLAAAQQRQHQTEGEQPPGQVPALSKVHEWFLSASGAPSLAVTSRCPGPRRRRGSGRRPRATWKSRW